MVGLVATLRLGAVVAATPPRLWLVEYPRLIDPSAPPQQSVSARAGFLAQYLLDAALIHGRENVCAFVNGPPPQSGEAYPGVPACLAVIDDALRANPSSGELWLFRAAVLMQSGESGTSMLGSLRRSYQAAPREGWIAAERVLLGLQLYPLLPPDLQGRVKSDLDVVLSDIRLARPLIDAYPDDLALRQAAREALRSLPADLMERFVGWVRRGNS